MLNTTVEPETIIPYIIGIIVSGWTATHLLSRIGKIVILFGMWPIIVVADVLCQENTNGVRCGINFTSVSLLFLDINFTL